MSERSPFYSNGLLRFKGQYLGEQMHGYWEFYRKDGTLMRSGTFDDGVQIGTWVTYDKAGQPYKETKFKPAGDK